MVRTDSAPCVAQHRVVVAFVEVDEPLLVRGHGHRPIRLFGTPCLCRTTGGSLQAACKSARRAPLLTGPVTGSRLIWPPRPHRSRHTAPAARRLTSPGGDAWIIAAMQQASNSWRLGADEVLVAPTRAVATPDRVRDPA